jgi:hypothetical protein
LVKNETKELFQQINALVSEIESADMKSLSSDEINDYKFYLETYKAIVTSQSLKELKGNKDISNDEASLYIMIDNAFTILMDEIELRLKQQATSKKIDLSKVSVPLNWGQRNFNNLSEFNVPVFQLFYDKLRDANSHKAKKLEELQADIARLTEGMSYDDFTAMINPNTGDLWGKFDIGLISNITSTRQALSVGDSRDIDWLKGIMSFIFDKDAYEKAYNETKSYLESITENSSVIERKMKEFVKKFNFETSTDALINSKRFLRYDNLPDEYHSEHYKQLSDKQRAFYDYWRAKMNEFNNIAYQEGMSIHGHFVPNIHKDLLENWSWSGLVSSVIDGLQIKDNEKLWSNNDLSVEGSGKIPILFNPDWQIDKENKIQDLGKALYLFGATMYNYESKKAIEQDVLNLRDVLARSRFFSTNKSGKKITNPNTGEYQLQEGDKKTAETFDSFIKLYLYGEKVQSGDFQILQGLMKYTSLKNLGLNPIAGIVNFFGSRTQAILKGIEGIYFSEKDFRQVGTDLIRGNPDNKAKALALIKYLKLDNELPRTANSLSKLKVTEQSVYDTFYYMQGKPERIFEYSVGIAMSKKHSLSDDNWVRDGDLPLWDMIEIKDGEPYIQDIKMDEWVSKNYDAIQKYREMDKRVMYKITGKSSEEDLNLYRTSLLGQLVSQYRGWMVGFIKDKWANPSYDRVLNAYEQGKYRVVGEAVGQIFNQANGNVFETIKEFTVLLKDMFLGGVIDLTLGSKNKLFQKRYNKYFKQVYQKYKEKYNLDVTEAEFQKVIEGKLRSMAREINTFLFIGLALLVMGAFDDDEKKVYAYKKSEKIMSKYMTELSFAFNPLSVEGLSKGAIPLIGLGADMIKLMQNTADETRDLLLGENVNKDSSPMLYYTMNQIPLISQIYRLIELDIDSPNKGESGIQISK